MKEVSVKLIPYQSKEYGQLLHFRNKLLRQPLLLDLFSEDLSDDVHDIMYGVFEAENIVGCALLHPINEQLIKLRQMAVDPSFQNKGLGTIIMNECEKTAIDLGMEKIILHARLTAKDFYAKLGYISTGEIFEEVTIPHVLMEKVLL